MKVDGKFWIKAGIGAVVLTGGIILLNRAIKNRKNKGDEGSGEGGSSEGGSSSSSPTSKKAYVKTDYTTIRTEPKVNNSDSWYDWIDNIIYKVKGKDKFVGNVKSTTVGQDGWNWYNVTWSKKYAHDGHTSGWVREDVVYLK